MNRSLHRLAFRRIGWQFALALVALAPCPAELLRAAEFRGVNGSTIAGSFPYSLHNPIVRVTALSGDGKTLAAQIEETGVIYDCARNECGVSAFLWSLDKPTGYAPFLTPTPLHSENYADLAFPVHIAALSYDGNSALVNSEYRHYEAAIHRDEQVQLLRPSIEYGEFLWGAAMPSDASVVTGSAGNRPFIWRDSAGLRPIEGLPADAMFTARAISGNGNLLILNGQASPTYTPVTPFPFPPAVNARLWSETLSTSELLPFHGDDFSYARALSGDGSIVVGESIVSTSHGIALGRAALWRYGSISELDALTDYDWSIAHDTSANGNVVVGATYNDRGTNAVHLNPLHDYYFSSYRSSIGDSRAVMWNHEGEAFDLQNLLETEYGLSEELSGWQLTAAIAISDDGKVIAGNGIDPFGNSAIWVASLSVPEPATILPLTIAISLLCLRPRRSTPNLKRHI